MTLDEFRYEMEAYRQAVNEEANEFKYPYLALKRLFALYHKFDADERRIADQVLAEWALSEDPDMRYDAQALIHKFEIVKAIPALQQLAKRLASSRDVGAPGELEVVNRIIGDLTRG
jgi:hypothetical protein